MTAATAVTTANGKTDKAAVYYFESSSDPAKLYETILWADGRLSCDCPGWTRRAIRECKHTRAVIGGMGERMAVSVMKFTNDLPTPARPTVDQSKLRTPGVALDKLGEHRAFNFDE